MAAGKVSRRSPRVLSSADKPSLSHENGNGDDTVVELVDFDLESEEEPEKKKQKVQEKLKSKTPSSKKNKKNPVRDNSWLIGEPVPGEEARQRWPDRYNKKKNGKKGRDSASEKPKGDDGEEIILNVRCHYTQAEVDGCIYDINDCAYVKGEDGGPDYIGRIIEFFETTDRQQYFTAQWFFKAQDTVIKEHCTFHDQKRVFYSDLKDDNLLECIISKLNIVQVSPNVDLEAKEKLIPSCDYYYDMSYSLQYSTFSNLLTESSITSSNTSSTISSETPAVATTAEVKSDSEESSLDPEFRKSDLALLDLYSGCGGMSTGLSLGAKLSGVNLVTRWAIDLNEHACQSLKLNHPETEVRNETADGFLTLLKEWEKLCKRFSVFGMDRSQIKNSKSFDKDDEEAEDNSKVPPDEFEIGKLVGICYGDPSNIGKDGLKFKVRWKGYGPSDDTWEPIEGLSKCHEKIREFVRSGYKSHILPFPGDVDVICGGPPCQGISGFNRFRNVNAPLDDPKNHQMVVFMDIVNYLKPKYVLMENVVDILKFAGGFLGRYALSRLVHMNYQARLGMMAAGCYGLPQFRMRVFLWGARPTEKLPQYPLPTHDVVVRGGVPNEFERNVVAYDEDQPRKLEKALLLGDAISDLPPVTNSENRDEMPYGKAPRTDFQRYIRSLKHDSISCTSDGKRTPQKAVLFDHKPLKLNDDDYLRVCRIPKRKSANFRDLPGVLVGADNIVEWDPKVERVLLPSGKPLVPDYAMTFVKGRSSKPFGRLWWDETVPTVVTRAEPHNQAILHPEQDRVLSIRENARLQGFPDCYKLCGPVKERYTQVGNAVAVPVARALGYALGMSYQGMSGDGPLMTLPQRFPQSLQRVSSATIEEHS